MRLQDVQVGTRVTMTADYTGDVVSAYGQRLLRAGQEGIVKRVGSNKMIVNTEMTLGYQYPGNSMWVPIEFLNIDGPDGPRPIPRRLGQKPDGDDHLPIDDPRIAWIFEDLAKYANGQNWCSQYDDLANKIGIPGREREISIVREIGGGRSAFTIRARSQADAEKRVDEIILAEARRMVAAAEAKAAKEAAAVDAVPAETVAGKPA